MKSQSFPSNLPSSVGEKEEVGYPLHVQQNQGHILSLQFLSLISRYKEEKRCVRTMRILTVKQEGRTTLLG